MANGRWRLLKDQTFVAPLNSKKLKNVIFAPFVDEKIRFVLVSPKGESVIQTLPDSELAITGTFAFQKIDAVSFKDLNSDGTSDIMVLTTFFDSRPLQGEGVGGSSVKVGFVFLSNKNKFKINDDCSEGAASLSVLDSCMKAKIKKIEEKAL